MLQVQDVTLSGRKAVDKVQPGEATDVLYILSGQHQCHVSIRNI